MPLDYQPIIRFINEYSSFIVVGHEDPDGDCLYSQLAMGSLLNRLGKSACLVSPSPFGRPEIADLKPKFLDRISACGSTPEAVIIVDCSTAERTGRIADEISGLPTAVIDHHSSGETFGTVRYIDPSAPSVTFLILQLMTRLDLEPTPEEADWLLFGLCTDTGYFRHLGNGAGKAFRAVESLVEAGASTKSVYYRMFGNRSFASRQLLGKLLQRAEMRCDGRLLVTWEAPEDLEDFGIENRDSDTLYRELQSVAGCEVVVLVRSEDDEGCSVGLRSLERFDVGTLARNFGGGGHKNASGYYEKGTVFKVRDRIVHEIELRLS